MKAFFVSALALLVSAATATLVTRQTDSKSFTITALDSGIPVVDDIPAYATLNNGRVFFGILPDNGAGKLIVAKYNSEDETIEDASDSRQKLWIVYDQGGAVYLQPGVPSDFSVMSPYQISSDGEVIFAKSEFPDGWTVCPANTPAVYELFYQNFADGCVAVKLVKSHLV